uniref:IKBKB interacting protein n=1 Tax=Salvator merianae TaxID=96440 RepID=A0A8D0DQC0_SALMN
MSEVKQRKKANLSGKPSEEQQNKLPSLGRNNTEKSVFLDPRTVSSFLSLLACIGLAWFLFHQSVQLTAIEKKYHLLKQEAEKLQDLENKIKLMSEKCEITLSVMEQLEDLPGTSLMKQLQEEMSAMKIWSNQLMQEKEKLQQNLTSLFEAVTRYEESTASVSKDFLAKIAAVKTDIRRISGLEADVTLLGGNLNTLEDKLAKAEKTTVQNISNLLTDSIDRTTKLRSSASENSRQIDYIKAKLSELNVNFNKQSNKVLDLESDRAKVLTTVAFANDLKPKVHNLRKDLAHLQPMLDELTLRMGRLFEELMERQKETAFLNKKLSNLTSVQAEIKAVNDELTKISDLN